MERLDYTSQKAAMRVSIITNDPALTALCEKTLASLFPQTVELRRLGATERPSGEVCIWEFDSGSFPKQLTSDHLQRTLFVVDQSDLERFRECLGALRASIVLKPVLSPTLVPFLQHSFGTCQAPRKRQTQWEDVCTERRQADLFELFMPSQSEAVKLTGIRPSHRPEQSLQQQLRISIPAPTNHAHHVIPVMSSNGIAMGEFPKPRVNPLCPGCGASNTPRAGQTGIVAMLFGVLGRIPLKCRNCRRRFLPRVRGVTELQGVAPGHVMQEERGRTDET
jgi:hypothetical protein